MSLHASAERANLSLTKKIPSAADVVGRAMPEPLMILTDLERLPKTVMV